MNLYQRDLPVPTSTSAVPGGPDPTSSTLPEATPTWPAPAGWTVLGCYTDAAGGRTLSQNFGVGAPVTIELCTSACSAAGFILAGTEYGGEVRDQFSI